MLTSKAGQSLNMLLVPTQPEILYEQHKNKHVEFSTVLSIRFGNWSLFKKGEVIN